jgi:hypothetical protein
VAAICFVCPAGLEHKFARALDIGNSIT